MVVITILFVMLILPGILHSGISDVYDIKQKQSAPATAHAVYASHNLLNRSLSALNSGDSEPLSAVGKIWRGCNEVRVSGLLRPAA